MYNWDGREYVRRSIRLAARDYAKAGCYFVTIRSESLEIPFCETSSDRVILTDCGQVIVEQWNDLPARFPTIVLDAFIVMPDHLHGIIVLRDPSRIDEEVCRIRSQAERCGEPSTQSSSVLQAGEPTPIFSRFLLTQYRRL